MSRQRIGRAIDGMVATPCDDGLIRIPLEKADDDLMADARNGNTAIMATRPPLGHSNPAGAVLVTAPQSIPRKLHLDPAMLVAINLFSLGANDTSYLWTIHPRLHLTLRTPTLPRRYRRKLIVIAGSLATRFLLQRLRLLPVMVNESRLPEPIGLRQWMVRKLKAMARLQLENIAPS